MRIRKAFFIGRKGRSALRGQVRNALARQDRTGREHGFHSGAAGVDRTLERGAKGGIRWSARASVGQANAGGALHHTHPKGFGRLSPQDLRSVVTSNSAKGVRNTLWAHSRDGHEAARLTPKASTKPAVFRARAFNRAYSATKGQGLNALRLKLKRYGLIHSSSTVRKNAMNDDPVGELYAAIEKARGLMPKGGSRTMLRRISRTGQGTRNMPQHTLARRLAYRSGDLLQHKDGRLQVTGRKKK